MLCSPVVVSEEVPVVTFEVKEFQIKGENPISQEKTDRILEIFLGSHQGLEGLLEATAELESRILQAGHSFHRVILPPQTLEAGVVVLEITQIKLANIEVEGKQ